MGFVFSKILSAFSAKTDEEVKIVMIGLNNAGKTTILYKMNIGEVIQTAPTTSFNTEIVKHNNVQFQVWDLAGQTSIRPYWKSYYPGTSAVIFVIDSSDRERLKIASDEFQTLLQEEELQNSPVLIFANKCDLENIMQPDEISSILKLDQIKDRDWSIFKTSAHTGEGLKEALDWLVKTVSPNKQLDFKQQMLINRVLRRNLKIPSFQFAFNYETPYNRRFQDQFKHAYNIDPLGEPTKVSADIKEQQYFDTFQAMLKSNTYPFMKKLCQNLSRCKTPLELYLMPSLIAIGLLNWPYALFIKLQVLLGSSILYFRILNKTQQPEAPETYIREMIHTHSRLSELFKVETTSTLDFNNKYIKEFPDLKQFPEFNNKLYQFMNNDGNFTEGEYTFGDVESNAMVRISYKTMPIRRKHRFVLGEPTFMFNVKAELTHNGQYEEIVLVDEKESLKKHRPYLIFQ